MVHYCPMNSIRILDISILNVTLADAVELLDNAVETLKGASIYFVNAECLNIATKDAEYREILGRSTYVFGDGSGVSIGSKMLGTPIVDNVNGTDMLPLICELCVKRDYSLYLLGAKPGVAEKMKEQLGLKYDTLDIRGCRDGYFDRETETGRIVASINDATPDILLVAFGAPTQEAPNSGPDFGRGEEKRWHPPPPAPPYVG